jgi:hypothetical protein
MSFLILSCLFTLLVNKKNEILKKIGHASIFSIANYIIGGFLLFPIYFAFRPIKIKGITYLVGFNLWGYWLISFIIITPVVVGLCAYFLYFKKVSIKNYYKEAILIGLFQLPWGWFFEIVIYVYMRKTVPTIYAYFFGKNFPWIDINWAVGVLTPLLVAHLIKRHKV